MSEDNEKNKCYELVTDDLVTKALVADKGEEAELLSFEVKPFTKEGDNYICVVAEVLVRYSLDGSEDDVSYVAKLNPLRPASSFTEDLEEMFGREVGMLSTIVEGMSKQLEVLELPPIKAPKLFSNCLEKNQEAFLAENLRVEGFVMHDRRKGLDLDHSTLVMKEIGRFHASSLLYEETLFPKTIQESFEYFKDPFEDVDRPAYKMFDCTMQSQVEISCDYLKKAGPKYEKCEQWLSNHKHEMSKILSDLYRPHKPFDVLIHGDCWTNNMLFKYDEENIPVDIRIVDLQYSSKASPASDINYFLYSSLSGDLRSSERETLIGAYYEAFQEVLQGAGRTVPLSIEELTEEIDSRKIFGLCCALLILPSALAEKDELYDMDKYNEDEIEELNQLNKENFEKISEREAFKERFLAVFDELLDDNLFD